MLAFPQEAFAATASDNFNRANGSLGSSWTAVSDGAMKISSNAAAGTKAAGTSGDTWTANSFTGNQFSEFSLTSVQPTGAQWIGATVRAQAGGKSAYAGIYYADNGSPELMLFKRQGGAWTQLGSAFASGALPAGTQIEVTASGSAITVLENGAAKISVTDTSLTGGAPGLMSYGTGQADNWSGGDVAAATTYTVGGTVSGLSGTAVLQDNGGDNLSVAANGSFTFATALATGAAYNVTVSSSPAGQSCTVSNAAGTIGSANVTNVTVTCASSPPATTVSDNFNRANGPLGGNWTDVSDGGLAISSNAAAGTAAAGVSGDTWTANSFSGDQFSEFSLTSVQPTGAQWIGATVRAQSGGQSAYVGVYYADNGSPELMLFKRQGGGWTQLGSAFASGALPAGTQLEVTAAGSAITVLENGAAKISVTDTSLTGGAPGLMSYGTGQADNWSGGNGTGGGTSATYTVNGTVSGLSSGTVVLQDNGTDSLSVSANGSFTFPTALATGAAYNVTVSSSPAGQSCTVSNAAGTIGSANVTNVAVTCTGAAPASSGSDDFNRANGPLGGNWTDIGDGGLAIASNAVTGTSTDLTGDIRTGEAYASNQYSQIQVTGTQLTGTQWIGAAVRVQAGGQDAYVGLYNWNNGNPEMQLFVRNSGNWTQLGSYNSGPLSSGTVLKVMVVGTTIAFLDNGTERIAAGDSTLSGGAPGIMINGAGTADNWAGGTAGFEVHFLSTSSSGVSSYDVISANDGDGPQLLRVLSPSHPAAGVAHNFVFVLPVQAGQQSDFGDGLTTLAGLDDEDKYNLTIIEPSFAIDPWFANNPLDPNLQYETFMTQELAPWVKQNLAVTGTEQNWLIGFSKSGIGGQDLLLKHPDVFTLAASWDLPADMSSYDQFGANSAANYGTDANFQANYRLTQAFVDAHKGPFLTSNRIWIGGYGLYQTDDSDYNNLLTAEGIQHLTETPTQMAHTWDSGWVPLAMAGLYQDSLNIHLSGSSGMHRGRRLPVGHGGHYRVRRIRGAPEALIFMPRRKPVAD
jgi:hypothetical protein